MAVYEKMMTMKVKAKYSFGFLFTETTHHNELRCWKEENQKNEVNPWNLFFLMEPSTKLKLALQMWHLDHFRFYFFILIYFHYLTFQLRSCAGISRSRCFLQPSIWMKMLISNSRLLQEKWAHKVVVAEECSIYDCCSVDLKEWLNTIQYVH